MSCIIAKVFEDEDDKDAVTQAKNFLEIYPRSKFAQPVIEFLSEKMERRDLVKWLLKWLRKNCYARTIYPALAAVPDPKIVNFARRYVEKLPPDSMDQIFLNLLKNHLDDELLVTTEKWMGYLGFMDKSAKEILEILFEHKPELNSDEYLERLIENEENEGFLKALLRHSYSKRALDYSLKYLERYPGSIAGNFLLGEILRIKKLTQSKAEQLVEDWVTAAEKPSSGLLIGVFWSYFISYESSDFIWSYCRKLGGKNVPKRCWVFRFLNYLDKNDEIEDWLLGWLEKNIDHRNAEKLLYELVYIVDWDARFRKILISWMKCTETGAQEYVVSQIFHAEMDQSESLICEEIASLILDYFESEALEKLNLFELERLIELKPQRTAKLLKKFWKKIEKVDIRDTRQWRAANLHLKCKHDKQIAKHQIEFLKDLSGGNVLNRLDTLELEAESYELLLDNKESARILPLAESFASKFAHIRPDLCARVRESIDA